MSEQQAESNNMLFTVNWWRKLLGMIAKQGQEYAALEGDNDYASDVMKRMIDTIESAIEQGSDTFSTTLYFEHADGRAVEFDLKVKLCEPDGTFDKPEQSLCAIIILMNINYRPTKPDELFLLNLIKNKGEKSVRDVITGQTLIPSKRCHYILSKWSSKGIYDYGVSLDLGWLVDRSNEQI